MSEQNTLLEDAMKLDMDAPSEPEEMPDQVQATPEQVQDLTSDQPLIDYEDQEKRQELRQDIFNKSGQKVALNDPVVDLMMAFDALTQETLEVFKNQLDAQSSNIIDNLAAQQKKVLSGFDTKANELDDILKRLEGQKEAIVADVWQKLDKRIADKIHKQLHEDMLSIANNANNKVNNQRNMLIGAVCGLLIGIVLCVLLFIFK